MGVTALLREVDRRIVKEIALSNYAGDRFLSAFAISTVIDLSEKKKLSSFQLFENTISREERMVYLDRIGNAILEIPRNPLGNARPFKYLQIYISEKCILDESRLSWPKRSKSGTIGREDTKTFN